MKYNVGVVERHVVWYAVEADSEEEAIKETEKTIKFGHKLGSAEPMIREFKDTCETSIWKVKTEL